KNVHFVLLVASLAAVALSGCSGVVPRVAEGYDASHLRKRPLVVYRKAALASASTDFSLSYSGGNLSKIYKKTFTDEGVSNEVVARRFDSIFFAELKGMSSQAKVRIEPADKPDSVKVVSFFNQEDSLLARIPRSLPDSNVLVLGLGPVVFIKEASYNNNGMIFLRADMNWVIYDPKLDKAVAGGRVFAKSSSLLGHAIFEDDWYADIEKLASRLVEDLAEVR
ncbi:MAG TPA: hypothetical protein PKY05_16085, partial [Fibrobacteria bacterium]|nr:hypothetical protein [Fibrobacteria bacterium]